MTRLYKIVRDVLYIRFGVISFYDYTQIFKFLIVGMLNTFFGYAVYFVVLELGFNYFIATFVATVLGILFNFKTLGSLVFQSTQPRLIVRFVGVYILTYLLTVIGVSFLNTLGVNYKLGGAIMLLPMAAVSYLLNKHYVFNK